MNITTAEGIPPITLKTLRLQKRWSQAMAAEKIGITINSYNRAETGSRTISYELAESICKAFGCNLADVEGLNISDRVYPKLAAKLASTVECRSENGTKTNI